MSARLIVASVLWICRVEPSALYLWGQEVCLVDVAQITDVVITAEFAVIRQCLLAAGRAGPRMNGPVHTGPGRTGLGRNI